MEHSIHCTSWAFIMKVGPMQLRTIKAALSSKPVTDDTNEDDRTFDPMEVEIADNSIDGQEFDPADLLRIIFFNIYQSSPCFTTSLHVFPQAFPARESPTTAAPQMGL